MLLVCGLGNKGATYRHTRHNIGYRVIEAASARLRIPLTKKDVGCVVGTGEHLILARPDTFMNISGGPVAALMRKRKVPADDLVLVHDDLDMDFGKMRIRWNGSDGGHRGVRSVIEALGTRLFTRMKVGIGRDPSMVPEEWVLSRFREEEVAALPEIIGRAVDALELLASEGRDRAMNVYNRQ